MKIWDWMQDLYHQMNGTDLLLAAGIGAFFWIFSRLAVKAVFRITSHRLMSQEANARLREAFEKPLRLFVVLTGLYLAVQYLLPAQSGAAVWFSRVYRSAVLILSGWGLYQLSSRSSSLLAELGKRMGLDASSMLIPFLSKTLRTLIVVIAVALVGAEWGFSINGLAAGMGLGSLAVALAAKETLGNIFGGIVIIMEKPFQRGDWILTPSVEGIVDDITFRSTRIRTFADAVVTVPNATLAAQSITNWSRMRKRRITFTLDVALDTDRNKLAAAVARIEGILRESDKIDQQTLFVKFTEFRDNGLGILLYFFTKTTVWGEHLAVREEMNMRFLQVLEEEGIRLAHPIQRIYVEGERGLQS